MFEQSFGRKFMKRCCFLLVLSMLSSHATYANPALRSSNDIEGWGYVAPRGKSVHDVCSQILERCKQAMEEGESCLEVVRLYEQAACQSHAGAKGIESVQYVYIVGAIIFLFGVGLSWVLCECQGSRQKGQ